MKYLQIFNIYIQKKILPDQPNYFGRSSFLQFHTNQTSNRIKLVYFLSCPQSFVFIPDDSVIKTQTFVNKNSNVLRKVQLCRVKAFKFLLHPKDLKTIFPVNKLNSSSFLFFQAMTDLNIPFVNFDTNLFENTAHRSQQNLECQQSPQCLAGNTRRFPSTVFLFSQLSLQVCR